jgi:CheY-like chemotaxis protein
LRAAGGSAPIVLMTAYGPADQLDLASLGAAALIPKPFNIEELIQVLQRVLARAAE